MSNLSNFKLPFIGIITVSIFLLPITSSASGYITKIDENGNVTVTEAAKSFRGTLKCGGVKAILSLDGTQAVKPNIMAVVVETDGSKAYPKRLMSEFDDFLKNHHTMTDFEVGCLTGDGGIGMIFKSSNTSKEDAHIQLDGSGRLFPKFNQTGYTLLPKIGE